MVARSRHDKTARGQSLPAWKEYVGQKLICDDTSCFTSSWFFLQLIISCCPGFKLWTKQENLPAWKEYVGQKLICDDASCFTSSWFYLQLIISSCPGFKQKTKQEDLLAWKEYMGQKLIYADAPSSPQGFSLIMENIGLCCPNVFICGANSSFGRTRKDKEAFCH